MLFVHLENLWTVRNYFKETLNFILNFKFFKTDSEKSSSVAKQKQIYVSFHDSDR